MLQMNPLIALSSPVLADDIRDIETSLDSLEFWLAVMTALVVLGLVLEYWYEVPEAKRALKEGWSWKHFFVLIGGILITVGVAGELAVQFFASRTETSLRKADDTIVGKLNAEAARARKDAGEAIERASKADERASKNESSRITSRLSSFAGQLALFEYNGTDLEAGSFALDLDFALQKANWKVYEPLAMMWMREGPVPLGTNPPLPRGLR